MIRTPKTPVNKTTSAEEDPEELVRSEETSNVLFDSLTQQLEDLAAKKVEGGQDIDILLAEILQSAPDSARQELLNRYRALVEEKRQENAQQPELTPEQEKQMELLKQYEQQYLAHIMSEKTLEKIRRMFVSNPGLLEQVFGVGQELSKKGILAGIMQVQQQQQEIGNIAAQPVRDHQHQKDTGRQR
jgi:hypothetical protein